ncbi:hypothetical protein CSB11_00545 [Candidatus Campbellbacteria bacterium]|nr:MAG: hypothetical protein CSB11_00545 [Candidatus Campbellbacteria bacterium]
MVKKKTSKKTKKLKLVEKKKTLSEKLNIQDETLYFTIGALLLFVSIFLFAGAFGYSGKVGNFVYDKLFYAVGVGYYLFPALFTILALTFFMSIKKTFTKVKIFASFLFLVSGLGLIELIFQNGGYLGKFVAKIKDFFDKPMSVTFFVILILISLVLLIDKIPKLPSIFKRKEKEIPYTESLSEQEEAKLQKSVPIEIKVNTSQAQKENTDDKKTETEEQEKPKKEKKPFFVTSLSEKKNQEKTLSEKAKNTIYNNKIVLPPLSLLSKDSGKPNAGDVKQNAYLIKQTLASFGIGVEIEGVSVGPTVARYSLKPKAGVKVSKIAALSDDLALALAAKSIIIQTPIPGQSLVGIEIPNRNKITVGAGSLFSSPEFKNSKFALPLAIGKDISGQTTIIGLEKTPHMLVAGATGAGKSVTVHAILNSLLYTHGPDFLKFILVDPKRVEMTLYDGIPHLLTPVITDAKKAILALRWAVNEMERRYEILQEHKLRDIASYHQNVVKKAKEKHKEGEDLPENMPYIVIVIDELSDIMQQFPKELESGIVSIAQKARAVGIHLILSTQRPSVNVVTGLIKANVPTRLALQTSSAIDSKTILDMAGAEKLLGQGDMLYMTGSMPKPVRVQSSFISEDEVKKVVRFIKKAYKNVLEDDINLEGENRDKHAQELVSASSSAIDFESQEDEMDLDPLYADAKAEVIASQKASTSYLQRKFGIGYARAAKLIDILEEKGVVGPQNGSKPREVLVEKEQ